MKLLSLAAVRFLSLLPLALAATLAAPAQYAKNQQDPSNYGKLPLSFEANRGQTDSSVQFLAHGQGYTLFLRKGEAVLALQGAANSGQALPVGQGPQTSVLRMTIVGSKPGAIATSEDEQITKSSYFLGSDPNKWRTNIPNYGRVRYQSVYEGIDLVYYGRQRQLEHDFIVAPNADPSQIVLAFGGQNNITLDPASGDLVFGSQIRASQRLSTDLSADPALRLLRPVTYQQIDGRRMPVASSYKLLPGNKVSFVVGRYDHSQPLIIDPVLVYSTYLGGSGSGTHGDQGNGIAVDSSGDAFVVGTTYSTNFPIQSGAFQSTDNAPSGSSTVFVSELDPTGATLLFSTFLGGSGGDAGYGIALDSHGNAYITGITYSTDFPVTCGAYQVTNPSATAGAPTAFVASLGSGGNNLIYSTYLGGSGNQSTSTPNGDVAQAIAVDSTGNAYITGYTFSANFPTTAAAFQHNFAGTATSSNAFVAKLIPIGTALSYSTYLGGSGSNGTGDYGNAIAIDASGDAYIAGSTGSANFPVTASTLQTQNKTSGTTGFITKLNPAGSAELYSTYLGGSTGESIRALAVDSQGFAYLGGATQSQDFPLTDGVVEGASSGLATYLGPGGATIGFVSKLSQDGSALQYSTFLEGQSTTVAGLAVDTAGDLYIAGSAPSVGAGAYYGFVSTPDALSTPTSSGTSAIVVKLDPAASVFQYASLLGGSGNDAANAIALDSSGNAYLTGTANSANFPTTTGAFQTTLDAPPSSNLRSGLTQSQKQSAQPLSAANSHSDLVPRSSAGTATPDASSVSNAFISKFALAGETNTTPYPSLPPTMIPTTTTATGVGTYGCYPGDDYFNVNVTATLSGNGGPAPTGTMNFLDGAGFICANPGDCLQLLPEAATGGSFTYSFSFTGGLPYGAPYSSVTDNWTVNYSGDQFYVPSSASGTYVYPGCPVPDASATRGDSALNRRSVLLPLIARNAANNVANNAVNEAAKSGPSSPDQRLHPAKFILPRPNASAALRSSAVRSSDGAPSCIASSAGSPAITPASVVFPPTNLDSTSSEQVVTVTNTSDSSLTFAPFTFSGQGASEFKLASKTCDFTLASGASCTLAITFTPSTTTAPNATFVVTQAKPNSKQINIPIAATVTEFPTISFSPTSLTFPATTLGVNSSPMSITFTNTSPDTPLSFTSFQFTGGGASAFSLASNTCTGMLDSGSSCTASVVFNPNWPGAAKAGLLITDNAINSPQTIPLSGSTTSALPTLSFSPTSITFPTVELHLVPAEQVLTVTNTSTLPLGVKSYLFAGPNASEFSIQARTCGASLAAGASCTLTLALTPTGVGTLSASLVATDDATGTPQSVPLSATVTLPPPTIAFSPTSLTVPATEIGTTSTIQILTVTNTSTLTPMSVSSYKFIGNSAGEFSIPSKTCGTSLAAGASCTLSIAFKPTKVGNATASLVVTDDAIGSPQFFSLSGTGVPPPTIVFSPTSLTFPTTNTGITSASQVLTVTNTSATIPISVSSFTFSGANASEFSFRSKTCEPSLAAGASCTLSIVFKPTTTGSATASLVVTDDATGSPQSVPLTGTGN